MVKDFRLFIMFTSMEYTHTSTNDVLCSFAVFVTTPNLRSKKKNKKEFNNYRSVICVFFSLILLLILFFLISYSSSLLSLFLAIHLSFRLCSFGGRFVARLFVFTIRWAWMCLRGCVCFCNWQRPEMVVDRSALPDDSIKHCNTILTAIEEYK